MEPGSFGLSSQINLYDCDPFAIRDAATIRRFAQRLVDAIGMRAFGEPVVVKFGPTPAVAGYSLVQLIETSSITGHFVDETNNAYVDIFSCKEYEVEVAVSVCREHFAPARVTTSCQERP
jgi:S-adenosylmethionine/arginine decarboxylase-like enzyme